VNKALLLVVVLAAGLAGPVAAGGWGYPGADYYAQASKGRQGQDRAQRGRDSRPERRPERDERRERLNEDERRALHRDLDKANRELYQRRYQR
jgi:hypothetical protein